MVPSTASGQKLRHCPHAWPLDSRRDGNQSWCSYHSASLAHDCDLAGAGAAYGYGYGHGNGLPVASLPAATAGLSAADGLRRYRTIADELWHGAGHGTEHGLPSTTYGLRAINAAANGLRAPNAATNGLSPAADAAARIWTAHGWLPSATYGRVPATTTLRSAAVLRSALRI